MTPLELAFPRIEKVATAQGATEVYLQTHAVEIHAEQLCEEIDGHVVAWLWERDRFKLLDSLVKQLTADMVLANRGVISKVAP